MIIIDANLLVLRNEYWNVSQCKDVPIAGFLIVSPVREYQSISEFPEELITSMGEILKRSVLVIERVIEPEAVYTACFNETRIGIHFHIFPRTKGMAELVSGNDAEIIDGPILLSKVRRSYERFAGTEQDISLIASDMRKKF